MNKRLLKSVKFVLGFKGNCRYNEKQAHLAMAYPYQ